MRNVIIFCANGLGELVLDSLDDECVRVIAFADNDPRKIGGVWKGIKIISPDEIVHQPYDDIIISYAEYADAIREQLVTLGVDTGKISVFQNGETGIRFYESRIALMRKCADTISERNIAGSVAEVGVYRGDFARLINRYFPDRTMYLFDTFEGFQAKDLSGEELSGNQKKAFKETSEDYVLSRMPYPERCIVRKGYFPETAEGIKDTFCFVSLDADLYKPMKAGLEFFYPRMERGGYIFCHDFGTQDWSGTRKAVYEFCEEHNTSFFPLLDRALSAVFIK